MSSREAELSRGRPAVRSLGRLIDRDLGWLLLAAVIVLGAGLGLRDPWPADEPRFALIARDMVHSGQWLFPHIAGELYSDKPPLFMWLVAALYAITGELRVAFLLPSLLAGLGMLALVHDLARRLWDRRVAMLAGWLLLASVQFALQARSAQLDALVAFWTTLGLYGLLRHLLLGPDWRWYAAAGLAMGCGVITKGVGFLPLLVLLPWAWWRWRRPASLPLVTGSWRQWLLGPAAMLLPIAAWLGPMLLVTWWSGDPALAAYRDDLLFRQTVTRYGDAWTHLRPAWYYLLEVIPWAWLPATLALPWLLPAWRRRLAAGDARLALLLGFTAAVLVFFSLSAGARGVYLLPALPAFVLAAAPALADGLLQHVGLRRLSAASGGLVGLLLIGAAAAIVLGVAGLDERIAGAGFAPHGVVAVCAVLGLAAATLTAGGLVMQREPAALAALLAASWLVYGFLGYPAANGARSAADLMAQVETAVPPARPLALSGWKEQMVLQAHRPLVHFGFRREAGAELRDAAAWLEANPAGRLLIAAEQMAPCLAVERAQPLAVRHGKSWMLADASALTGACSGEGATSAARFYDPAAGQLLVRR